MCEYYLVSNLEITPGINLKTLSSHQIPRSIIPNLGETFQSTLPSQLFESFCMGLCSNQAVIFENFSQEFEHGHIMGENALHFLYRSSVMNNILQFINISCMWLEKLYKDQFHLFSIFEQQMGLISFSVLLHYNLSPFDPSIFPRVNIIECPSRVEEKTKNCLKWLNHESCCLIPSRTSSHFYDLISILMNEVLKSKF